MARKMRQEIRDLEAENERLKRQLAQAQAEPAPAAPDGQIVVMSGEADELARVEVAEHYRRRVLPYMLALADLLDLIAEIRGAVKAAHQYKPLRAVLGGYDERLAAAMSAYTREAQGAVSDPGVVRNMIRECGDVHAALQRLLNGRDNRAELLAALDVSGDSRAALAALDLGGAPEGLREWRRLLAVRWMEMEKRQPSASPAEIVELLLTGPYSDHHAESDNERAARDSLQRAGRRDPARYARRLKRKYRQATA